MQVSKRPIIVMEFAEGGDLFESISNDGRMEPQYVRAYFKQLFSAVKFLAKNGVSHRDIKPENILLDKSFNLKLADFGLATEQQGLIV